MKRTTHSNIRRTNMCLKEEQFKELKALSAKTDVPMSALIRRAIGEFLKKTQQ
jgi:predicted DNA-binding protein